MSAPTKHKHRTRSFLILLLVVIVSGLLLKEARFLSSPFAYSQMMLNAPSGPPENAEEDGFTMVDISTLETETSEESTAESTATNISADDANVDDTTSDTVTTDGAPTPGDFSGAMPPEGGHDGAPGGSYSLSDYFNFAWQDFGDVLYNLWLILALTVSVIVVSRPVGWLVKRFNRKSSPRSPKATMTQQA